ncbi:MAG: hypothetical protein V1909_06980, partial [Candidatus Micrarchaeota archaeon]
MGEILMGDTVRQKPGGSGGRKSAMISLSNSGSRVKDERSTAAQRRHNHRLAKDKERAEEA